MEFFVNILTLTACFATMAYCYVLAKRINTFGNMKDGMGALIEEMIRTTTDLQSAFNATEHNIDNQYHKIQDKIDEGIALSEYLTSIMNDIEKAGTHQPLSKTQVSLHKSAQVKQSTLPDSFRLSQIDMPIMPIQQNSIIQSNAPDPFADIMPSDFDSLKRKKRPKIIIPGEEYL